MYLYKRTDYFSRLIFYRFIFWGLCISFER